MLILRHREHTTGGSTPGVVAAGGSVSRQKEGASVAELAQADVVLTTYSIAYFPCRNGWLGSCYGIRSIPDVAVVVAAVGGGVSRQQKGGFRGRAGTGRCGADHL